MTRPAEKPSPQSWECPACQRRFGKENQGHFCNPGISVDDHLQGKPEAVVLAFEALLRTVGDWPGVTFGASLRAIIFTRRVAFLIVWPKRVGLDLRFYLADESLGEDDERLKRDSPTGANLNRMAWSLRMKSPEDLDGRLLGYLRAAWAWAE